MRDAYIRSQPRRALGQVLVIAFEFTREEILRSFKEHTRILDDARTVLIIKPHIRIGAPGWKFPGGMVENNETFEAAAARELHEETGIHTKESELLLLHRTKKKQRYAGLGDEFPIYIYAALECDFSTLHDAEKGERGDEYEIARIVPFGELNAYSYWDIPAVGGVAGMLPVHLRYLEKIRKASR